MKEDALLIKTFNIKLRIKDKDGRIVELSKCEEIEVTRSGELQKEVVFEKGGNRYVIILELVLGKLGWWRIGVKSYGFYLPPNAPYQIYHGSSLGVEPKKERENHWLVRKITNEKESSEFVKLRFIDQLRKDRVVLSFVGILVLVLFFLLTKERTKKKNPPFRGKTP